MHLQPDKFWIPSLVTSQMVIHRFIHFLYGREEKCVGKVRGHGKRKDGKIKEDKIMKMCSIK